MSALAGFLNLGADIPPARACGLMLSALQDYGPDGSAQQEQGDFCLGLAARHVLPEDDFEQQPLIGGGGNYLFALDGRIDNRSELAGQLGVEAGALARMSDARLALTAWERWQIKSFDFLLGDLALVVWDSASRRLVLARSPLSHRPLFYHRGSKMVALASMPIGILALPSVDRGIDRDEVVSLLAGGGYRPGPGSLHKNIHLIRPGTAVELADGREQIHSLWDLDRLDRRRGSLTELSEMLRAELDRAVTAQLRRRTGGVACHLSAGRDSSAVAATAALILRTSGEQVTALTAAPRRGFNDGSDRNWLVDESELAAATAATHDNLRHLVCRPDGEALEPPFDQLNRHHFGPVLNPCNLPWLTQINRNAANQGASILLVGSTGNFSISFGGRPILVDLLRERGLSAWWRQAAASGGHSLESWRGLLSEAIGPWVPRPAYHAMHRMAGRTISGFAALPLLRPPFRQQAEAIRAERYRDWRPPRSYRQLVKQTLMTSESGSKMSSAIWGLDLRDPTSDRRLVELCLSLPAEALFSADGGRPAFEAAFADRLPATVWVIATAAFRQRIGSNSSILFVCSRLSAATKFIRSCASCLTRAKLNG